jgi:hypothetical protein
MLMEHALFGKPVSTRRIKSEGMLFRIMLSASGGATLTSLPLSESTWCRSATDPSFHILRGLRVKVTAGKPYHDGTGN